ncbi:DNA-binding response regulator, NarL/FixJ family, contains REC and HTH domains [Pustulibacterium marinum]|uniref:DNA-binding response regulator, NarL/FixJ family, contains REC and HTH domains n=1 Tax=Pustulibacterium marinum TaxID=1224947 RepID=A0A1I7GWU9_9FLAO|nr:response regulator transcription factor [Pustulibacterium marinum]SFU52901.1 DNA-binding response regulator, NarL/FixJ family, contains REC and HTH domains [Pustulibacterium marinum]
MNTTTLCLIDDHKIVRQGLKGLLERMDTYKVTHEFDSGVSFLEALPLSPAPDLYILDYSMPFKNGIEVLKALGAQTETLKFLLLTQNFDEAIIDEAYYYGARGFLHKNCTAQELKSTIDAIVKIGYSNVADILKRVRSFENKPTPQTHIQLSEREMQFLTLVCQPEEYTYDQIADIMGLSVKSIEAYRAAIFDRYDIKSKVGLVLFSYQNRLTPPFIEES